MDLHQREVDYVTCTFENESEAEAYGCLLPRSVGLFFRPRERIKATAKCHTAVRACAPHCFQGAENFNTLTAKTFT